MYGNNSGSSVSLEDKKLFVGGLGWDTSEKQVRDYFSKYGDIENISIKMNPNTGRSRGFAFIVFANEEATDQVLNVPEHIVNGRKVEAKKAIARTAKVFVGGLRPEITNDDVRSHFSQFGRVVDLEVPFDKQKNQRKGFCFVTFEQEQVANELMKNPQQSINGYHVDLRRAQPKVDYPYGAYMGGTGRPWGDYYAGATPRGGGGGGGGRGGYGGSYGQGNYQGYGSDYGYGGYDYGNGYGGGYGDYHSYSDVGSYPKGGRGAHAPPRQNY